MAGTVSNFNIKVSVDSKTGEVKLDQFGDKIEKTAQKGAAGFSKMNLAAAGLVAGLGALAVSAVKGAAEFEKYNVQFEVLLGSAEAAQKRIEELKEFAASTPFQLPDIVQANKLLQTFGGEVLATGESLTMVGDMAAAAGVGFQEIATWVGRAYTNIQAGKPFGEAAARLQELGLMSGETRAQLEEMQKQGASSAEVWATFQDSMGGFTGMMEKQAATLEGVISTLKDNIGNLLADAATPFLGILKELVTALSPIVQQIGDFLIPIFDDLAAALKQILPPFGSLLNRILKAMQPVISVVLRLVERIAPLFGKVAIAAEKLVQAAEPLIDVFAELAEDQMELLVELLDSMLDILIPLTDIVRELAPLIALSAKATAAMTATGTRLIMTVVTPIVKAIRYIIEKGAEAARWVASIFGGDEEPATKAKTKPSGGGGGGGTGPQEGDISPDGKMVYKNGQWVPIEGSGGGGGGTGKASPVAGSIPALEAQLKLLEGLRDNTVAGSAAWADYTLKIAAAQAELDMFKRIANDLVGEGPEGRGVSPFKQLADEIALVPVAAAPAIDATVSLVDKLADSYENLATIASNVTGALGNIFAENFKAMKGIAVAETIISTAAAIMRTLRDGGAWALPIALSVGALGATQIAKIIATEPGSSGGGGSPAMAPVQSGTAPMRGGGPPVRRLNLSGGDSSPMSFPQEIKLRAEGGDLVGALQVNTRGSERSGV